MHYLPEAGAASAELTDDINKAWIESVDENKVDLAGFDPKASLAARLLWAMSVGLVIGTVLSRFSSKMQHSTSAQVHECVVFAARNKIYVPPEFVCVDEGASGRKSRRDGLDRVQMIIKKKMAEVLLVFKVSRLFRAAYKGMKFFQEDVVEEGLRAISVTQGIDTRDEKTWKPLAALHGMMDEALLTTIADHVRAGLKELFQDGYVTGALPVGYERMDVPGARLTKTGRPRAMPRVQAKTSDMIRQHFEWIRDGLSIKQGWRRWVKAGGPCDPRSTVGRMTYGAYRRMLSNPRYIGAWAFGKKRNRWNSKLDYNKQIDQPDSEVIFVRSEELRIVSDELFYAVQERLAKWKQFPHRGPKRRHTDLWDCVTDCFYCAHCSEPGKLVRFYTAGAKGNGMRCKDDLCGHATILNRKTAVHAVCERLSELIQRDTDLIQSIIVHSQVLDAAGDGAMREEMRSIAGEMQRETNKIKDLMELAGGGTDEDRAEMMAEVRLAQARRTILRGRHAQLQAALDAGSRTITPDDVRQILRDFSQLLMEGAAGTLGSDESYRAAEAFRLLVGERIMVHVEPRPARKRVNARGSFVVPLVNAVRSALQDSRPMALPVPTAAEVWLRPRPKRDLLAERAHQLIDIDGLSYRGAEEKFRSEGVNINSGVVWQLYERYYEMIGQPKPKRPYNNGIPRESARRPAS